jgi:uncharacterized protein (DUF1778 family)
MPKVETSFRAIIDRLMAEGRVNLSLDAAALAMIDEAAGKRGLTRSAFLVSAARDKVLAEG